MTAPSVIDPFFRQMYSKLEEELDDRVNALARGSALILGANTGIDATTTAMKYQAAISYIEALQAIMELGLEMDKERYRKPASNNGDD